MSALRACKACGAVLVARDGEAACRFARRVTCNATCGMRASALTRSLKAEESQDPTPRSCPVCGSAVVRRPGESLKLFKRRRACSKTCGNSLKQCRAVFGVLCTAEELAEALGISTTTVTARRREATGEPKGKIGNAKVTAEHVAAIRRLRASGLSYQQIASSLEIEISESTISHIVRGRRHTTAADGNHPPPANR